MKTAETKCTYIMNADIYICTYRHTHTCTDMHTHILTCTHMIYIHIYATHIHRD